MSIWWPSSRVTIAFLIIAARIALAAGELALALDHHRVDRLHLDLEQVGDRLGDGGLGGVRGVTRNTTWLASVMRVAFSVITGERMTS